MNSSSDRTIPGAPASRQTGDVRNPTDQTERVLQLQDTLLAAMQKGRPSAWLTLDLTMSELKTLIVLGAAGNASGGILANALGVGLSTVTGIVDRLRDQGLVSRGEDPNDRR